MMDQTHIGYTYWQQPEVDKMPEVATLPAGATAASATAPQPAAAANSSPENYAFLNHSSSTVPNNLPPKVDDKPLARQKRKRTRYTLANR